EEIDIHDPVRNAGNSGFLPEELEWMSRFLASGFVDSFRYKNPDRQEYTWWSYRSNARANNKGWRLDYCMTGESLRQHITEAYILSNAIHSDHCPAVLKIAY
ncbi:MAG: exodeoxyribonuclease III, partial [Tannerellaceae bacterium]|nr:exodeoxyribonuclease III [Tannerellaceae bacterium]